MQEYAKNYTIWGRMQVNVRETEVGIRLTILKHMNVLFQFYKPD